MEVSARDGGTVRFTRPQGYVPVAVTPKVKPYSVPADLSTVENISAFRGLSPEQRAFLAENLFFAAQSEDEQLFYVYEGNAYRGIPSFYTADVFLQLFYLIYDFTLRDTERYFLAPSLEELTRKMLAQSLADLEAARAPAVRSAALKNVAYFALASKLLELPDASLPAVPEEARALAESEAALIRAHEGRLPSALFPYELDYTQFIPRGHYAGSPELERYFRAMMWYGLAPLPARYLRGGTLARADEQLIQALLMARALERPEIEALWLKIYEPTVFFVGRTDDLSVADARRMMEAIWGPSPPPDSLADGDRLDRLVAEMDKPENQPRIKQVLVGIPTGVQFRFMGQRYIPDSEIMQELVSWPHRRLPRGLDVLGVLGSARAEHLLFHLYREAEAWPDYAARFSRLKAQFSTLPEDTWRSNLYYGWLWALQPLIGPKPAGMPSFMLKEAWSSKDLETCLGSWSELRHATILYGKGVGAESGDGMDIVPQYVEPEPEFYQRLDWVVNRMGYGLASRKLLSEDMASVLAGFREVLGLARDAAVKELTGVPLGREEVQRLMLLGGTIEGLSVRTVSPYGHWGNLISESDRHMAVIADVATSGGGCLEVGVGPAKHIYVIFPFEGRLYLGRGAMFAYHEFEHPITDRLTDEAWRKMLKAGTAPPQQEWIRAYTIGPMLFTDGQGG
ncbi:MAG: DUF3160 domain-containing protein [Acetobacteraceae bacterium]|nr:DUF3160 domain-containing protein [Acetobacteraceae bacterium]